MSAAEDRGVQVAFIGGPIGGCRAHMSRQPRVVRVLESFYERVDDPDTGRSLDGYVLVTLTDGGAR